MNVFLCGYGSYVLFVILSDEYTHLLGEEFMDKTTGTVVQGEWIFVVRYLIHEEAVVSVLFVLCVSMISMLVWFLGFHLYLVSSNITTNEFFKWRNFRRAYTSGYALQNCGTLPFALDSCTNKYNLGSLVINWREVYYPRYKSKILAIKMAAFERSGHRKED